MHDSVIQLHLNKNFPLDELLRQTFRIATK